MLSSQRQVVGGHQDHENYCGVETEETEETMILMMMESLPSHFKADPCTL